MRKMKFVVEKVLNGARLGFMEVGSKESLKHVPTPTCFLYTRCGLAPCLTPEMLSRVKDIPPIAQYAGSHFADHQEALSSYDKDVKTFTAMHDFLVYSCVQDAATALQSGYNDKSSVSVWTRGGRLKLDVESYMQLQAAMQPSIFQALCDSDTDINSSKKRVRKAVDRTLDFLDACIDKKTASPKLANCDIFGTIAGGHSSKDRIQSAKETSNRPVAGFVIEGFYPQGPKMQHVYLKDIADILDQTLTNLPSEKPRMFPGVLSPDNIMEAVAAGLDIFDTSFVYIVSERGGALTFPFDISSKSDTCQSPNTAPPAEVPNEVVSTAAEVKQVAKENENTTKNTAKAGDESSNKKVTAEPHTNFEINLNQKRYFDDFGTLHEGCTCFTCTHHTRAYVCHLLNTSEILAGILLNIHNLHHYNQFFTAVRCSIKQDKYAELHKFIMGQR